MADGKWSHLEQQWNGGTDGTWYFRLDADWPGDSELLLGFDARDGEQYSTYSGVELMDELKDRSPAQHLRTVMDVVEAAMQAPN